jgi:hypothetical protein
MSPKTCDLKERLRAIHTSTFDIRYSAFDIQKRHPYVGIAVLMCSLIFLSGTCPAKNYYIDAINGSDHNNGLSVMDAWQSLHPVNVTEFQAGDSILFNGPVRSIIKIKGMNWDSGNGFYEYEQTYTVYAKQSYCRSVVNYTTFSPNQIGVKMGCGFRKKPNEDYFIQGDGVVISSGPEAIRDPENIDDRKETVVDFVGTALIVKKDFQPQYQFVSDLKGNHTFKIMRPVHNTYEYLLASAWSEGAVYNNKEEFTDYIQKIAIEYNHPLQTKFVRIQEK